MEHFLLILQIALYIVTLYSVFHLWKYEQWRVSTKIFLTVILLLLPIIGLLIYWKLSDTPNSSSPKKAAKKIGQQGSRIYDVESALSDIQNRYRRFYRMLYDDDYDFGHFLALSDSRKEMILEPLRRVLDNRELYFSRFSNEDDEFSQHYDFYLGELNQNGESKFGVYSWEWEEDEDGDTSITYFAGDFENGQPAHGVWYHLSNEDAKIWVRVDGQFYISAIG